MLFRVVFYSTRSFLDLSGSWCTSSRLFALHPGSFWTCMYLIRVVFWPIRVLSEFVLLLAAPLQGCFLIVPGSFWTCMYLIRVVFWSIRVLSEFVLVLAAPLRDCLRFIQVLSERLSWFLPHLVGVLFRWVQFFEKIALTECSPRASCFCLQKLEGPDSCLQKIFGVMYPVAPCFLRVLLF